MPGWDKKFYGENHNTSELNQRPYRFESAEAKRDVMATKAGYVIRKKYTDIHGNSRVKDEILIPLGNFSDTIGPPSVVDVIWTEDSSLLTGSNSEFRTVIDAELVFSEPVNVGTPGSETISIAVDGPDQTSGTDDFSGRYVFNDVEPKGANRILFRSPVAGGSSAPRRGTYRLGEVSGPDLVLSAGASLVSTLDSTLGANTEISNSLRTTHTYTVG